MATTLEQVFDTKVLSATSLGDYIAWFYSREARTEIDTTVREDTQDDHLHVDLAPSFRDTLSTASIMEMDAALLVMITATMNELQKERSESKGPLTWEAVVAAMMRNPLLEPSEDAIVREDKFIKEGFAFFKFNGKPSKTVVDEVHAWYLRLIDNDADVQQSISLSINAMEAIVAQTGATVTSFATFFHKTEEQSQTVVEIVVLRFPDIDHPYFKIYRVKLAAWSHCSRVLAVQKDENGIRGEFASHRFHPRKSVIERLSQTVIDKAVADAKALLSSTKQ
ncbi:hypothetical protein GY45DRAFT_1327180 [Cubamyces sp. BRFM 1775]|nr:hypothetical protein GY45DRAFT_1327180 [Cubamyces sp. BRFM 1775]